MLRESTNTSGEDIDFGAVTGGTGKSDIPYASALTSFAEAVVTGDAAAIATCRESIARALGEAAMIDAAAVIAAFHGFVRVADATGVPVEEARLDQTAELRAALGIDAFRKAG